MLLVPLPIQATGVKVPASQFYGLLDDVLGVGVCAANDLQVIQNPAGADLSVTVAPGATYAAISNGGKRRILNDANSNSGRPGFLNVTDWLATFTAADPTNPRIDRVVVMLRDANTGDGTGAYDAKFKIVPGTPTSGATLSNLTGAAAIPANCQLLANVLVSAAATTISTAQIDTTVRAHARIGGGVLLGTTKTTTSALSGGPPASPSDGDFWIATGVNGGGARWHFQYDAAEATASKWKFVGGPRRKAGNGAGQNTINNTWQNTGGISIPIVRAGHYIIEFGGMLETTNTSDVIYLGVHSTTSNAFGFIYKTGAAASVAEWNSAYGAIDTIFDLGLGSPLSAGSTIFLNTNSSVFSNVSLSQGWVTITPIMIS